MRLIDADTILPMLEESRQKLIRYERETGVKTRSLLMAMELATKFIKAALPANVVTVERYMTQIELYEGIIDGLKEELTALTNQSEPTPEDIAEAERVIAKPHEEIDGDIIHVGHTPEMMGYDK